MTISLSTLEKLAREATPGPWSYADIDSVGGGTVYDETVSIAHVEWDNSDPSPIHRRRLPEEADANGSLIAACSPDVILKLVRIARAAINSKYYCPEVNRDGRKDLEEALKEVEL